MKDKVFIDSNFFIYLYDNNATTKKRKCAAILPKIESSYTIVISTQVIKEVSAILLKKFNYPVEDVKMLVRYMDKFEVAETPAQVIQNGLDLMIKYKLSFWDAVICATAELANCSMIITEDMNDGQKVMDMKIQSPFTY